MFNSRDAKNERFENIMFIYLRVHVRVQMSVDVSRLDSQIEIFYA